MKTSRNVLVFFIVTILVIGSTSTSLAKGERRLFFALATGSQEVPPRDTQAVGAAAFALSKDGDSLRYILGVKKIHNVVQAHIHLGRPGENGPVVAFLFGPVPPGGGPISGMIAKGTITEANLIGPLAGHSLDDLVQEMKNGNTYVNVHTNDGIDPPNTGPGDFPGGEVRGPIEHKH
jgi:hypothetical protein